MINPNWSMGYDPMNADLEIAKPIKKYYKNDESKAYEKQS